MFPFVDIQDILGYPNHFCPGWGNKCPKFDGDPSLAITHVVNFLKDVSETNVTHQDVCANKIVFVISRNKTKELG
jgi:hypothetical protein